MQCIALLVELYCISGCQDSRQRFRAILVEATLKLDEQVKKIGKAVEESKPYWEARRVARQVRSITGMGLLTRTTNSRADVLSELSCAHPASLVCSGLDDMQTYSSVI